MFQDSRAAQLLEVFDEFHVLFEVVLDLGAVIEVIGEGGVDLGQREVRVSFDDLVGGFPLDLGQHGDILNADARGVNIRTGLSVSIGANFDVRGGRVGHSQIIRQDFGRCRGEIAIQTQHGRYEGLFDFRYSKRPFDF